MESATRYGGGFELDDVRDVVFHTDAQGHWTFLNRAWTEITGFGREESIGRVFLEFVHPDDRALNAEKFAPLIRREKDHCLHVIRYLTRDGGFRWIEVHARLTLAPDGSASGTTGTLRDVTARQQAEATLRDREERIRSMVTAMREGVLLVGSDGLIQWANLAASRILRVEPESLVGRQAAGAWWQLVGEGGSGAGAVEHPVMVTLRTGEAQAGAVLGIRREGGDPSWLLINTEPLRRETGGTPYAAVATFEDVTEAKRQRDLLDESRRQLAMMLLGSDDGCWDLDLHAHRYTFSERCFEIVGERPQGPLTSNRYWLGRLHPDDVPRLRSTTEAHIKGESPLIDLDCRLRHADGSWRWIRARGKVLVRDMDGVPTRVAGTARDITARREAQDRLRAAVAENERLVTELRSALSSVRTLKQLLPICAWCGRIRNDSGEYEDVAKYISQNTGTEFSHTMCPRCFDEHDLKDSPRPDSESTDGAGHGRMSSVWSSRKGRR